MLEKQDPPACKITVTWVDDSVIKWLKGKQAYKHFVGHITYGNATWQMGNWYIFHLVLQQQNYINP